MGHAYKEDGYYLKRISKWILNYLAYEIVNTTRDWMPNLTGITQLVEGVQDDPEAVLKVNMPPFSLLKLALKAKPELIGQIEKKVQGAAFYDNRFAKEHLRKFAVRQGWQAIKEIDNPSLAVQKKAVARSWEAGLFINYYKGPLIYSFERDRDKFNLHQSVMTKINYRLKDCNSRYQGLDANGAKDFGAPLGVGFESELCLKYAQKHGLAYARSMLTVMRNGNDLDRVEVRNNDIVAIAIQNGLTDYSKVSIEMTPANQKLAVKLNPDLTKYELFGLIKNPCKELVDFAMEKDPRNVLHARNPTEEQLLRAVQVRPDLWPNILHKNGLLIKHVSSPSDEWQVIAVTQNPDAIIGIYEPCNNAQNIAVNGDAGLILQIKIPCEQAKKLAIRLDPTLALLVPDVSAADKRDAYRRIHEIFQKSSYELSELERRSKEQIQRAKDGYSSSISP